MRKKKRRDPTVEDLKNPDQFYELFLDLYHRVGRLEGSMKILIWLVVAIILGLVGLFFRP